MSNVVYHNKKFLKKPDQLWRTGRTLYGRKADTKSCGISATSMGQHTRKNKPGPALTECSVLHHCLHAVEYAIYAAESAEIESQVSKSGTKLYIWDANHIILDCTLIPTRGFKLYITHELTLRSAKNLPHEVSF